MKKTMRSFNSTLRTESVKHREKRLAGLLPKKRSALKPMSKKMKSRVSNWRKTAKEICTVNGILYCALCGKPIVENYVAHHYKERRGQAHSTENDKYVVALHEQCHNNINHYSDDFYVARDKIEQNLEKMENKMKKLISSLVLASLIITNNAIAAQTAAPLMMSAAAVSMAASASAQAHKAANTVGLGVLAGKQIENCLILQAYWSEGNIVCVCLNKNKDEVYHVRFRKPKDDFSQGVFDELRKQFNK